MRWGRGSGFTTRASDNEKIATVRLELLAWRTADEVERVCQEEYEALVPKSSKARRRNVVPRRLVAKYVEALRRRVVPDDAMASVRKSSSSIVTGAAVSLPDGR